MAAFKRNKNWRDEMPRRTIAAAFTAAACCMAGAASAEPVKIALIETLSGGQAVTGKLFQSSVKYGLAKLEAEKAWPDGIKLLEYDNQGGPSEAADKLKAAINVGAEAMEFTGPKCHFYHFRWNGNAEIRLKAMLIAMKEANALGHKVYIIGQNYSWGHDVQKLTREYAKQYDYVIVGDVIHDVNKIQDFAPYVAKIKEAAPDTVVTGNWSNDLLLLMKAAGDSGLKARFLAYWIDQPGNIANAGDTALGHYTLSTFFADANGEKTAAFAEDFKAKTGQYPLNVQGHTVHGMWGLGEALKALKAKPGDKLSVKAL